MSSCLANRRGSLLVERGHPIEGALTPPDLSYACAAFATFSRDIASRWAAREINSLAVRSRAPASLSLFVGRFFNSAAPILALWTSVVKA